MRVYPAIDLTWPSKPGVGLLDRLLADVDGYDPAAVEELPHGARVFFRSSDARDRALAELAGGNLGASCVARDVPDDDWAARSQADLGPVEVGRLIVAPPWAVPGPVQAASGEPKGPPAQVIIIRPAMGFGSGHHASTRLALGLLQRTPVAGARVLDVGTGSGVLALAAWRLGAAAVVGFDRDEDALASARESRALNPGADVVTLRELVLDEAPGAIEPHDIVLANLTADALIRSADTLATMVRPAGWLILSGILSGEADAVAEAFAGLAWRLVDRLDEGEWAGLVVRQATSPSETRAS